MKSRMLVSLNLQFRFSNKPTMMVSNQTDLLKRLNHCKCIDDMQHQNFRIQVWQLHEFLSVVSLANFPSKIMISRIWLPTNPRAEYKMCAGVLSIENNLSNRKPWSWWGNVWVTVCIEHKLRQNLFTTTTTNIPLIYLRTIIFHFTTWISLIG